ncbi:unnamed protein product [Cuscuta campestris]|uniref:Reverse transcriptase domain-containing protein n=1 Tax=Cuscuta campestris TaxID=132261 RepID=A0A484MWP9_9ASTE|nr:unnamed protein product [Cuscuta campestris]
MASFPIVFCSISNFWIVLGTVSIHSIHLHSVLMNTYSWLKEMLHHLSSSVRGGNGMFKLDLTKGFDRISWPYLGNVLGRFGFSNKAI